MKDRTEFTDDEFCTALDNYRNQPIMQSMMSKNALERMFAVLDYRVGKRSLLKLVDTLNDQPLWLQDFYRIRLESENISM